jgi:2-succinyl-5-enolpyruvyl-6-hydroxy-3-cyclohexene-1-carboxylate synthase
VRTARRPRVRGAVAQLAGATGFPILADALANVRSGTHDRSSVIARHDAILRSAPFRDAHRPDLVIRFGGTPTSKALTTWIAGKRRAGSRRGRGRLERAHARPRDDGPRRTARVRARAGARVVARGAPRNDTWLRGWQAADGAADAAIRTWLGDVDEPFEGRVWDELPDALPADAIVFAGNSMPVRDLDAFLPPRGRTVRCLANRGANGIDGLISTALGVAAVEDAPVVLVIGDVSFVHDLNALVAARLLDRG